MRPMAVTTAEGITIGLKDEKDLRDWFNVSRRAMLDGPLDDEAFERTRDRLKEPDRCIAAWDDRGRQCGSALAFGTELTVPGGSVAAAGVTAVGVLPTHRRQGHLTRMIRTQLTEIAERGEPVAALISAEYPIYGRYGYGPATDACSVQIDAAALSGLPDDGFRAPPSGRTELLDNDAFYETLLSVYDRARAGIAGHIRWDDSTYRMVAGLAQPTFGPDSSQSAKVVWYDDSGEVQGAVTYTVESNWQGNRPLGILNALPLVTATEDAHRELLRYLVNVDWIASVRVGLRPVDDLAPLWLKDGRVARLADRFDHIWVRVLDVPAALTARRYQTPGEIVLQVDDPMGFAGGRFLLEVSADVATDGANALAAHPARCVATDADPDVTVPVGALGAAYLGGVPWARLAAAGEVQEHRAGAVSQATAMFTTPRAPWCALTF